MHWYFNLKIVVLCGNVSCSCPIHHFPEKRAASKKNPSKIFFLKKVKDRTTTLSPFLAFFWNSLEKHLPQNSRVRNRCFTLPPGIRLCLLVWHIFRDLSLASLLGPFEDNYIKPALDFPFNKLRLSLQKSKEERP